MCQRYGPFPLLKADWGYYLLGWWAFGAFGYAVSIFV